MKYGPDGTFKDLVDKHVVHILCRRPVPVYACAYEADFIGKREAFEAFARSLNPDFYT